MLPPVIASLLFFGAQITAPTDAHALLLFVAPSIVTAEAPEPLQHGFSSSVAGIRWTKPQRWTESLPRPMRVATYAVTDPKGSTDGAECAVFFFGQGQGGSVDENIARWGTQFEGTVTPKKAMKTVNGLKVTTVQISGTYLSPGGPMMQSQGSKKNYRLLGAIVEAPEGPVFFKLTGPVKVISSVEKEFDALVESVKK